MSTAQFWSETDSLRKRYNRHWVADHFAHTVTRRENSWTRRRLETYEKLAERALDVGGERRRVDEVRDIDPSEFGHKYLDTDTPLLLKGAGKSWAASNWTPEMIAERYGETTVRLLRASPGEPKGRPGEGRDASYAEIVKSMQEGGELYARFAGLMQFNRELVEDIDLEWFRTMRRDVNDFEGWGFFMGGAGTATGLHSSIAPNLFYQITGEKRWYIYPAKAAPFFAPAVKCSPFFYSEVDVSDTGEWPIAEAAPGWFADLEPGDVLWVPSFAWHQVHNYSATMAVGYRWQDPRLGWRTSRVQTTLVVTCSNPPIWKAVGYRDLPKLFDEIDY